MVVPVKSTVDTRAGPVDAAGMHDVSVFCFEAGCLELATQIDKQFRDNGRNTALIDMTRRGVMPVWEVGKMNWLLGSLSDLSLEAVCKSSNSVFLFCGSDAHPWPMQIDHLLRLYPHLTARFDSSAPTSELASGFLNP